MRVYEMPALGLEQTVLVGAQPGEAHRELDRLTYPPREVEELQELVMFAPAIDLSPILHIAPQLFPIAHSGELTPGRWTALPEVQQHRLARLGPETRQGGNRAIRIADILAVGNDIGVRFDKRPRVIVAIGE